MTKKHAKLPSMQKIKHPANDIARDVLKPCEGWVLLIIVSFVIVSFIIVSSFWQRCSIALFIVILEWLKNCIC